MKTRYSVLLGLLATFPSLFGQTIISSETATISPAEVLEKGPHSSTWKQVTQISSSYGKVWWRTNFYTELKSGAHYFDNGQWLESREDIDLVQGGAAAVHGVLKVQFAANLNSPAAIQVTTRDNKSLHSHVLGLAYTDPSSGKSVLVAELKDSIGAIVGNNQVVYQDAFTDIRADVRYTYTKGAMFEQDVILRQNPPSPAIYGLNPETTRLEVFTEFINPPEPTKSVAQLKREGLPDESLRFGKTRMGRGRSFPLDAIGIDRLRWVTVAKTWETRDNRQFLIEAVPYPAVKDALAVLPQADAMTKERIERVKRVAQFGPAKNGQFARVFPPAPKPAKSQGTMRQMAAVALPSKGLVMDYILMDSDDVRLEGDKTYYVSGAVWVDHLIVEGGAVVKYANDAYLDVGGDVQCLTEPYHPAVFTGKNDNTVGQTISGSTGNPSDSYANVWMYIVSSSSIHDVRFSYSVFGLVFMSDSSLQNVQFTHAYQQAVEVDECDLTVDNALFYRGGLALFGSSGSTITARHITADECDHFSDGPDLRLTNSLLVNVTNLGTIDAFSTNAVVKVDSGSVFQTVGMGSHYLANNSPYRNAGVTNLPADIAASLKTKTTSPPLPMTNTISTDTVFVPRVKRDADLPDLGYHYEPIDYLVSGVIVTNATLTVTNGAVIAAEFSMGTYGIAVHSGAAIISEGSPTRPNRFIQAAAVQESPPAAINTHRTLTSAYGSGTRPSLTLRFTHFTGLTGQNHFYDDHHAGQFLSVYFKDCEIKSGNIYEAPYSFATHSFTAANNLFERVNTDLYNYAPFNLTAQNNTFIGGTFYLENSASGEVSENLFDKTLIVDYSGATHFNNAYVTNFTTLSGATNTFLAASPVYEKGAFGAYYVPTNSPLLIDAGHWASHYPQLYHYCSTTNQVKEEDTLVNIGYHYVAADLATLKALDTDGDDVPDYKEDVNGNGSFESGDEKNWQQYNFPSGTGSGAGLEVFTPLKK